MEFTQTTLPNGLRVAHIHCPDSQMAAVNVLYNTGARDDRHPHTGMAHLLEHLMFGGSLNVAAFDRELELAGGKNNAWTSDDFTNYWCLLPAANIETALWLESDRMLHPNLSEESLKVQRSVVIEEFKQVCLNQPYGDFNHHLRKLVYRHHPYGTPTIGRAPEDIASIQLPDVREFFTAHYAPNNAVLAIASPQSSSQIFSLAQKWFGSIPPRHIPAREHTPEPEPTEERRLTVEGNVPDTRLAIVFPMAPYGSRQYFAADIITDILANGRSARFRRNLIEVTDLFTNVDAVISGHEENGMLMVNAITRNSDTETIAEAERAIWHQLNLLAENNPSQHEFQRALNKFESNLTFQALSIQNLAQRAAMTVMHGETPDQLLETYRSLTPDDIRLTAASIFRPHRARTLIYRPFSSTDTASQKI